VLQLADRDYFTDPALLRDPYAYFEAIRERGAVHLMADGVLAVVGYDEALEVLRNSADFSSSIAGQGPAAPLPFVPSGPDITDQIEAHRAQIFGAELLVGYDDSMHAGLRAIINQLFTPSRLKANSVLIGTYADEMVSRAVKKGRCELVNEIATPFVTFVIADLLGIPAPERKIFMDAIEAGPPPGSLNSGDFPVQGNAMAVRGRYLAEWVVSRRQNPTDDMLSELSLATFPDGALPPTAEVVKLASFLFGAGQDTSAKLLGNAMRYIVDTPGLQDALRADPALIVDLLEEVLRLEGSTKMTARLARKDTRIGDLEVPAGTRVFVALAAANRDPRRWIDPQAFVLGRPRAKEHLSFGRGAHVCAGAPLARVEVRIILEKFLAQTSNINLDRAFHGEPGARTLDFEPSFIIRGLSALHMTLE
jgi:cytochrome P450